MYIFIYQTPEQNESVYIKLQKWYDDLPISDWNECDNHENDKILNYFKNVPDNFVLGQIGDDLYGNVKYHKGIKTVWANEDYEKQQITKIEVKFDNKHNIDYYNKIITNLINEQVNRNKIFKQNEQA